MTWRFNINIFYVLLAVAIIIFFWIYIRNKLNIPLDLIILNSKNIEDISIQLKKIKDHIQVIDTVLPEIINKLNDKMISIETNLLDIQNQNKKILKTLEELRNKQSENSEFKFDEKIFPTKNKNIKPKKVKKKTTNKKINKIKELEEMDKAGLSATEIAKRLSLGITEVELYKRFNSK